MRMMNELNHMFLYSANKKVYVPIDESDRRRNSAILLLTPNLKASMHLTMLPYLHNPSLFTSFYIDRNIGAVINKASIEGFDEMENPLKFFFQSCFRLDPNERPSIEEIKQMEFFSDVNWEAEALANRQPPYQMAQLCDLVERAKYSIDLRDRRLLGTVNWRSQPNLHRVEYCGSDVVIRKSHTFQNELGYLSRAVARLFDDFEFINEKVVQNQS